MPVRLTLEKIRSKFPEAEEVERGRGRAFVVNCWRYHKHGGRREMEISPEGLFCCHNDSSHRGNLFYEFPDDFDSLENEMPWAVVIRDRPISSAHESRTVFRRGKTEWAPGVYAPGDSVPFSSLPDDHPAVEYLAGRGFDIEELRMLSRTGDSRALGYCRKGDYEMAKGLGTTSGRIIFPLYGEEVMARPDGGPPSPMCVIKGWQARQVEKTLWETETEGEKKVWLHQTWRTFKKVNGEWEDRFVPKYYTSPGMNKGQLLGGLIHAKGFPDVAVVEGPLDYYKAGRHSVFTMGKSVSKEQIRLLKANWPDGRIIIVRDPEVDPKDAKFQAILDDLHPLRVHHLALSGGRDPGATPRSDIWNQIAEHVGDPLLNRYANE